ncbi:MAG: helix-turn-helix domain-containing protein [Gordonia sp. (in: high G+C Gram-positive bacteria)]
MASSSKLAVEQIVDAAIDLADRDGLAAVSMRRIAEQLGVGAMSLYRHVADKDALLAAMSAEVGRRFPYPVGEPGPWTWRERVTIAVDVDWKLYRRHPWVLLTYSVPRYGFGPECLDGLEWLADGFAEGLGVDDATAVEMGLTLWNHINGAALVVVSEQLFRTDVSEASRGGLAELLTGDHRPDSGRLAQLPRLAAVAGTPAARRLTDLRGVLDAGVESLCDGFEAAARA